MNFFRKRPKAAIDKTIALKQLADFTVKMDPYEKANKKYGKLYMDESEKAKINWKAYIEKSFAKEKKNILLMNMPEAMALADYSNKTREEFITMGQLEGSAYSWDDLFMFAKGFIGGIYKLENQVLAFYYFREKYGEIDTCEHLDLASAPLYAQLCPLGAFLDKRIKLYDYDPKEDGYYFDEANEWEECMVEKYGRKEFDKSWKSARDKIERKHQWVSHYLKKKYEDYAYELMHEVSR